ncbi:hypothetical protein CC78DRAFT_572798 [Lojkania enalia]|uniref:Rhodopsin domain-containing protein n=1 Tax=Lojkania enalia TaxID=147567 RepID=A0A9P4N495_9PLEO|nr:hypothetical protein CC78DRAFT_572798 [Didymosphaeria enalia]
MAMSGRGLTATEVSGVFSGLALIVVIMRLYTRFFLIQCASVEDYFVALAMLCSIGLTICIGLQAKYGMGMHVYELEGVDTEKSLQAFWASLIVYYLSLGLTKSSILLQYKRVFSTKEFQIACWTTISVVTAYTSWTIFGSIFACIPVRAFWTKEQARCINQFAMWFTNAAINIATDLAIILLPMPVIRSLNLPRRQKQALIGIFAIGGFVCIVSILRLQSLVAISNSNDQTYDNPPAATWSSVEANIGIICSCLPCLRPLITRFLPGVFSSRNKYNSASGQPYGRSTFGRPSNGPATMLEPLDGKFSQGSSDAENLGEIQVVREVRVTVEDKEGGKRRKGEREGSTETLVRGVA